MRTTGVIEQFLTDRGYSSPDRDGWLVRAERDSCVSGVTWEWVSRLEGSLLVAMFSIDNALSVETIRALTGTEQFSDLLLPLTYVDWLVPFEERPVWLAESARDEERVQLEACAFLDTTVLPFIEEHGTRRGIARLVADRDPRVKACAQPCWVTIIGFALDLGEVEIARVLADRLFDGWKGRRARYATAVAYLEQRCGWRWDN